LSRESCILGADTVVFVEGNTDGRANASARTTRRGQRPRHVQTLLAREPLIREYQGVEYCVTVRDEDCEYQGRPFRSLSAVARAITGTRWNGPLFFGLKNRRAPS
jgi:hypothetical protein